MFYNGKRVGYMCKTSVEMPSMFIVVDSEGNELLATYAGEEPVFTATPNDIREGSVAATNEGITLGTKVIPSYVTNEGYRVITAGSEFDLPNLAKQDCYDYTKLQVLICPVTGSIADSVAAEKVVIGDTVYPVQSNEPLASVVIDHENKAIKLGITNESAGLYLARYFTYKEIY